MRRWIANAYLTPELPKVFAVGHDARSRDGALWAALLDAGPGAALSHATAAHARGLIDYPPTMIEVSTPRDIKSLSTIRVHARRRIEREVFKALPVTTVARTMLDLAAGAELKLVRKALARLDYRHELDVRALQAITGKGRPGSKALLEALEIHQPRLAHTNGPLEFAFFEWCEHHRLPLPLVNVRVHGILVDAYWPEHGLVVELDGFANHSSPAQLRRDKANDLTLRRHGIEVRRYDWALLHAEPEDVREDLTTGLAR